MTRTLEQNKRFHTLISVLGIDAETKQELVYNASGGLNTSSKCLTYFEMEKLIDNLQVLFNRRHDEEIASVMKMRRKIFSIFHDLLWEKPSGSLDYKRINDWFLKSGYLHKSINDYKEQELPQLVSQVEQMLIKTQQHVEG
jgi:hypothetical protein